MLQVIKMIIKNHVLLTLKKGCFFFKEASSPEHHQRWFTHD